MKARFYAYLIPGTNVHGTARSWAECERLVKGASNARYRGFKTEAEARAWLQAGAQYENKPKARALLERGIYFDAGTGRGAVEISVTNEKGNNLLHLALPKAKLNRYGKRALSPASTNNYGELLAAKYALEIALQQGSRGVWGDSKLIVDYWSKGHVKSGIPLKTRKLAQEVAGLRAEFESAGGKVAYVPGGQNPADLGFHR